MNLVGDLRRLAGAAALTSLLIPLSVAQTGDLDKAIESTSQLIVMITDQLGTEPAFGAGIVVGRDHDRIYIATANHVVRRGAVAATNIRVVFKSSKDKSLTAKLLPRFDVDLDVAVVAVEGWAAQGVDGCKLPFDKLGEASELKTGNTVYAIGNPNGEKWRMPTPDRLYSIASGQLQFQSAFIASGSSGGALLNDDADIVGMVRRDEPPSGSAIPMSLVLPLIAKWGYPIQLRGSLPDDATPLHIAAHDGNIERIKAELAAACSDIEAQNFYGDTPIVYAVRAGQLEAVRVLIQRGANVRRSKLEANVMEYAAEQYNLPLATLLVNAGASVSTSLQFVDPKKTDPPDVAHAKAEFARYLIAAGADVNTGNRFGHTLLLFAMEAGNHEMVTALLEAHADVNREGPEGRTPLLIAIRAGDTETIRLLLRAGADPKGVATFRAALDKKNGEMVALMLKSGARLSDAGPIDVVQEAIRQGWTEVLELALKAGADVNELHYAQFVSGEAGLPSSELTALEIAAELNSLDMVKLLMANKANVNRTGDNFQTPLHLAACKSGSALIKLLLDAGANVKAVDSDRSTPLHLAIRCRNEEAARALLQAGANVDARDSEKQTPLTLAKGTPLESLLSSHSVH